MASKKKVMTSVAAVAMAAAVLFGGTFAWQSISQTALNEVYAYVNPGGRLHDDFVDVTVSGDHNTVTYNKDVYVENFTSLAQNGVQVFARVRLDEYMEFGKGAGVLNEDGTKSAENMARPLVDGTTLEDKNTWISHKYMVDGYEDPFAEYWTWDLDGETVYMPTYNKNKDSLEADINGTFDAKFKDYVDYTDTNNQTANDWAIYDIDTAPSGEEEDELVKNGAKAEDLIESGVLPDYLVNSVKLEQEEHTVKATAFGNVISMQEYMDMLNDPTSGFDGTGNYWVWDEDGWAYWANPIDPAHATGLLLDQIQRTETIINEDWYYAINVVAQFVTGDDLGQADGTGFYDLSETKTQPTANALLLLNNIGVDVNFEVETVEELQEALTQGGTVTVKNDVTVAKPLVIEEDVVLNLEGSIAPAAGLWDEAGKDWSVLSVRGADTTVIINDTGNALETLSDDSFCIDVRDGAKVVIYGGNYVGNITAVYVYEGEAAIYGGTFSIQQLSENSDPYGEILNCYDANYANGTAKLTVCGGEYVNFDPSNANDGDLVPDGYRSVIAREENGNTIYRVEKITEA